MATATITRPATKPTAKAASGNSGSATLSKTPSKTRTVNVLEFSAEPLTIDREKGIVHGVKILGRVSKNGHRYSDVAIRSGAQIYSDADVNLNHPPDRNATAERLVQDGFGVIRNPQVRITGNDATDGVYGEHHYPQKHPYTEQYLENVERFPRKNGFSHNAVVTESVRDGNVVFESIERVRSVDLVRNPATTRGIFESEYSMGDENALTDPNADPNATAAEPAEKTTDEQVCEAMKMAIDAILDDADIPLADKKTKIMALLDTHDEITNGKGDDEGDGDGDGAGDGSGSGSGPDDAAKDDTASLKNRLTKLEQQIKARDALESARSALEAKGFRPSKVEVKMFAVLESDAERSEFIDTLTKAQKVGAAPAGGKPRSTSANALESQRQATTGGNGGGGKTALAVKSQDDLQALTYELMRP
jgi:hypothetical protein